LNTIDYDKINQNGLKSFGGILMTSAPFMRPPAPESEYEVGDSVEVLCDHDRKGERVHGWLRGIVVQTDPKMVAVQFRANVYLTDGWMVPDHILWFPQLSNQIRKPRKKQETAIEEL
jgi:hypothetical protein